MRRRPLLALVPAFILALPAAVSPALAGELNPFVAYPLPSAAEAITVGDVTGDGRADVVVTTRYVGDAASDFHLFVLPQDATGRLGAPSSYSTAGSYTAPPTSVAVGDLNGDGRLDVAVGLDRFAIQVFLQEPDGGLGAPSFTATPDSTRIRLGQLDGDGTLDVAGIGWGSNTVSVFRNPGSGQLAAPDVYPVEHAGYDDLELGDLTGDGLTDIVVMSGQLYSVPNISVLARQAAGGFGSAATYRVGTNINTHGIGIGDINGDGRNDVVASYGGNRPSSFIAAFTQTAAGTLAAPVSYPSYDIPEPVEAADLDRDGRTDVVTLHGGWYAAGVYQAAADGSLAPEQLTAIPYASHYSPHGLAIGDVTGDGWPDVVAADYNNGVVILANAGPPPATPPSAPTLTAASGGDASIAASWTAPVSDGGTPVTLYTARAVPAGGSTADGTCTTTALSCTIGSLVNGTTYRVTVTATNAIGTGPASNALTATPLKPATAPSAPRNLVASTGPKGITLSWAAPTSNGGSPLTAYRVYRSTSSGTESFLVSLSGTTLTYLDRAISKKTRYYYWVSAVNAVGEGGHSNEVSAAGR